MKSIIGISLLTLLACTGGCASMKQGGLTVRDGECVTYECANGQRIVATYYSLSDGSLEFVKVVLPDGKEHTLPHVVSASGARYTDDVDLVWWTKGDTVFVETRNEHGEWQVSYPDCRAMLKTK